MNSVISNVKDLIGWEKRSTNQILAILKHLRWADTRGDVAGTCRSDVLQRQKPCAVHTGATCSRDKITTFAHT